MGIDIVTKEDLEIFRRRLLEDISGMLKAFPAKEAKPWLKNLEVKKLLGISSNTIQRLRIAGKLHSTKVGGVHYYRTEDIMKLFETPGGNHARI